MHTRVSVSSSDLLTPSLIGRGLGRGLATGTTFFPGRERLLSIIEESICLLTPPAEIIERRMPQGPLLNPLPMGGEDSL